MVAVPIYNILLLGPTQAGKSTFLENVKLYADPSYTIDSTRIGDGNFSHTQDPYAEVVTTTLPMYKLYQKNGDGFDPSGLKDERSFKMFLTLDDDLVLLPVEVPGSSMVQFRIIDTPGLNDTDGNDIKNIAKTLYALSDVGHLNMIIVLESHKVPLSLSQVDSFKTYFELFEELIGLVTIVHTNSPNRFRVPGMNLGHDKKLKERSDSFNRILGRVIPTMRLDCDPDEKGPAHMCMTWNAIREILEVAKVKAPVSRNTTQVRKLKMMINVDNRVHNRYKAKLEGYLKRCQNESQKLTVEIENTKREIKKRDDDIDRHDTNELLQLFEGRFDEQVDFFGWFHDLCGRANNEHIREFPQQEFTIDDIDVAQQSIDVLEESGGRGLNNWRIRFKRHKYNTGYYHVVLKTMKSTRFRTDIEKWRQEVVNLNKELEAKKHNLSVLEGQDATGCSGASNEFAELRRLIDKCRDVLYITKADMLPLDLFMDLADAGVYQGIHKVDALEKFFASRFDIV